MFLCNDCQHEKVCGKCKSTGGYVKKCEDFMEDKHGYWMPQFLLGQRIWDCSNCNTIGYPHWKRCPACESIMDGEMNG